MGPALSRSIPTLLGEVGAHELGVVLAHDHLFVRTVDSEQQWGGWDEDRVVERATRELTEVAERGVRTIFDPTVDGLGRDVRVARRINEAVPELHIVAATGIYTWNDEPFYWRYRSGADMTAAFVADLTGEMRNSGGIRAGFIKCAVDEPGLVRGVSRILNAAAAAHLETGSPLMVHTHPGTRNGEAVADRLEAAGVSPSAVVLAHSGDSSDPDYLEALARRGYFLGMDRLGAGEPLESQRVQMVAELCRRGFAGSMMLSHDSACHIDWLDPQAIPAGNRFLFIDDVVVPRLAECGITREAIQAMRVDAPARWMGVSA
jgi:phosphotriesterase-related protein